MLNLFYYETQRRMIFSKIFPLFIFLSDFVIYVHLFYLFGTNKSFNENETFFLFFVMIFVLLFDWFLWGSKKFSWLQIIKFSLASLSSNYLAVEIQSFFLLSFDLFYSSIFRKGEKDDKILTSAVMFLFSFFVLFRFYVKGLTNSLIIVGENILFLFPLLVMRTCNEISFFEKIPTNKWQLFCQNKYEIPVSLISWFLPFCLAYLILFDVPFFCVVLFGITIPFCFIYDFFKIKKENESTILSYTLEMVYKFGIIILLLNIKD